MSLNGHLWLDPRLSQHSRGESVCFVCKHFAIKTVDLDRHLNETERDHLHLSDTDWSVVLKVGGQGVLLYPEWESCVRET